MLNEIFKLTGSRPNELEKKETGEWRAKCACQTDRFTRARARLQGIIKLVVANLSTAPEANPRFERLRMWPAGYPLPSGV
jgi:hypothetical protein